MLETAYFVQKLMASVLGCSKVVFGFP